MSKLKVVHVPEVCEYNEFVERTCDIQEKAGIEVIRPNVCIDGDINTGSNDLRNVLKYKKPDDKMVIHFHWPEKMYKTIPYEDYRDMLYALKESGVKFVKTTHNLKPHEMKEEDKKKDDLVYSLLDGYALFSDSQLRAYVKENEVNALTKVIPHPNYKVHSKEYDNTDDKPFVLCIPGRIRKYKQTEIITDVIKALDGYNVRLYVVGKPDDADSVELLNACSSDKLVCNFNFVTSEELENYIKNSDMVLLTHKKIWTSGIAVLAANIGTTLVGSLPKIFEDYDKDKIGYFLDLDSEMTSEKMTELIKKAISDGRQTMNSKAQNLKKIIDQNTDEAIGKLYLEMYGELFDE